MTEKTEKPLSRLYLFNGDDTLKQEMLLERLIKRFAESSDLSMNSQTLLPRDITSPAHILDVLNTIPFASDLRLVIIREADRLTKDIQETLIGYIQRPSETSILVLVAEKLAANTRLYKAVHGYSPSSIIDCSQKKRSELPQLIINIAKGEGVNISASAAKSLIDRLGTSTVLLSNETKKLAAIIKSRKDRSISERDVAQHVPRLEEPKPWDLTNALALRNTSLCLKLAGRMQGYTAVGLFALCIVRIREILSAKQLKQRGVQVAQKMGKQDWQIRELLQATELYSQTELESLLKQAPEIELQMKSGADADLLLKLWIIEACEKKQNQPVFLSSILTH